jgi:hypothetical protein
MPLYRQEKKWEQFRLDLSRTTMVNWIIRYSQDWLAPVVELLKKELLKCDISHSFKTRQSRKTMAADRINPSITYSSTLILSSYSSKTPYLSINRII